MACPRTYFRQIKLIIVNFLFISPCPGGSVEPVVVGAETVDDVRGKTTSATL
jgi:hypothetical protein